MDPSPALRVLLADDHEVVRSGLRSLLEATGRFEVVAEAGDVETASRRLRGHRPDVAVLDLNMPGGEMLDELPAMGEASPGTALIVLTMQSGVEYARRALQSGAAAYLLKESAADELLQAIDAARAGGTYLSPGLGARLAAEPRKAELPGGLTPREVEVLRLVALGHTNGEIAERLYVSQRTVETHRSRLQAKAELGTRAELVRFALTHGLIGAEDPGPS